MFSSWQAGVLGHVGGRAVVQVLGSLLVVEDRGALPDGAQVSLLIYEGENSPAMSLDLGRFNVEARDGLAVLTRASAGALDTYRLALAVDRPLPSTLRLWLASPQLRLGSTDPKVFGAGTRAPHVSPAETYLHYMLGQSEKTP